MKKSYLIAAIVAVASVLWIMSGVLAPHEKTSAETPAAEQTEKEAGLAEVRVRDIEAESVTDDVILTGRTAASRTVTLKAEVEGQVAALLAEKGDTVKEGEVIAKLEERDRKARVAEAEERLSQRTIEYNAAESLETQGFNSKVRLAQARADLEEARAALEQAKTDFEKTEIKAPFDGVIYEQFIEVGDFASLNSDIFSLVDLDPIEARGFLTELQVQKIEPGGTAVAVFIDGTKAPGKISYIAPAANPQTRTFATDISIPNPEGKLVDGMTVQIIIPATQEKAHKISPAVLSLNDEGQVGVKIVNDQNKVEFMPVRILSDEPDHMYVGGLPDKVRLITVGQDYVMHGQEVKPVPAEGDGLL